MSRPPARPVVPAVRGGRGIPMTRGGLILALVTAAVLAVEVPRPEAGRPAMKCLEGESAEQCARRHQASAETERAMQRVRATYQQVLGRSPAQEEVDVHLRMQGPWSVWGADEAMFRAAVRLLDRADRQYPRHGRIVVKGWAEIPQWLPDDNWLRRHAELLGRGALNDSSLRTELADRTATWAIERAFEAEIRAQPALRPFLLEPSGRVWTLARKQVDQGTAPGINGLVKWLQAEPQVRKEVAELPRLERDAAVAALEAAFMNEVRQWPALGAYLRNERGQPLKQALADLRAGHEGGGPGGIRRWLARPEVRERYWGAHQIGSRVASLEREAVVFALRDAFERELGLFPELLGYLTSPAQPPFRTALVDLRAGREGGGAAGLAAYLKKPGVRDYYWTALGIARQYAVEEREAARRALAEAFARELRSQPDLMAYLGDESQPPLRTALVDLRAGREGGGAAGIAAYLGKPGVRDYYWTALGIAQASMRLTARDVARDVVQAARKRYGEAVVLLSALSNKCVSPVGAADGAPLQLVECTGYADQRFVWAEDRTLRLHGKCVEASGGQGRDGDAIVLRDCRGGANQQWGQDADGHIKGIHGRCLDVEKESVAAGARLVLWQCKRPVARNQQWLVGRQLGFAYVFFRPNMPVIAGHVGWGYQQADGKYRAGAVDGTGFWPYIPGKNDPTDERGYHWIKTFDTESAMKEQFRRWGEGTKDAQYTEVRRIAVINPNYDAARAKADAFVGSGYLVLVKNCMDETNAVVQAYGAKGLPWPQTNWFPYVWFGNMASTAHHRL